MLLAVLVRLAVSPWLRPPGPIAGLPTWQRIAAAVTHGLMFPGPGGAARPGHGPRLVPRRPGGAVRRDSAAGPGGPGAGPRKGVEAAHSWLAYGLIALLALHLAAVAFNRLVRKVQVVDRMLPAPTSGRLTNRMPVAAQLVLSCGAILALTTAAGLYGAPSTATSRPCRRGSTTPRSWPSTTCAPSRSSRWRWRSGWPTAVTPSPRRVPPRASWPPFPPGSRPRRPRRHPGRRRGAARIAAGDRSPTLAAQVDDEIQTAVDSQSARVLQGRLAIANSAAKGHDLIVLTLFPTC